MMYSFCSKRTGCIEKKMRQENEIRREWNRREKILQRMKNDSSCPTSAYSFMELYISALKWILGEE